MSLQLEEWLMNELELKEENKRLSIVNAQLATHNERLFETVKKKTKEIAHLEEFTDIIGMARVQYTKNSDGKAKSYILTLTGLGAERFTKRLKERNIPLD